MSARARRAPARLAAAAALAAIGLLPGSAPAAPASPAPPPNPVPSLVIVALPMEEARALAEGAGALGLGVYPESRTPARFLEQIGTGAPVPAAPGVTAGRAGALRRALDAAGVSVGVGAAAGAPGETTGALGTAFGVGGAPGRVAPALSRDIAVLSLAVAEDVDAVRALTGAPVWVLGIGERTPVLVIDDSRQGLLDGGIARRRGIMTSYDLSATFLDAVGAPPGAGFVGRRVGVRPDPAPLEEVDRLAARLERDDGYGFGLAVATTGTAAAGLLLALAFGRVAPGLAGRALQVAAWAPAGYVGGVFVPDERAEVRALAVAAATLLGLALPPRRARAWISAALLLVAAGVAGLTIAAAARPDGEPALSLWGDPLVSWRFFGLRNHLVAFVASGAILGPALAGASLPVAAGVAVTGAVVAGAPSLGANFVGVLVLGVGAGLAIAGRRRGPRSWHLLLAALIGAAAFTVALAGDAASPVSHGGQALRRVSQEGVGAAWDIVKHRIELNAEEIRDFAPPAGYAAAAGQALLFFGVLVWSIRRRAESGSDAVWRAGIAGAAALSLASLALEDSGVLVAAIPGSAMLVGLLLPWVEGGQAAHAPAATATTASRPAGA